MTDQTPALNVAARSRFAQAAAAGCLRLPVCQDCGTAQYPVRDACANCLSDRLVDQTVDGAGTVVAWTALHRSNDPRFTQRLPLRIGSVRLDVGPLVITFLLDVPQGGRVVVTAACDAVGQPVLSAHPLNTR